MNTGQLPINYDAPALAGEEALVFSLLVPGRQNARSADLLAEITGIERRRLERIVRRLRWDRGIAVGSSSGRPPGYYIITDPGEFDEVYDSLRHRGIEILRLAARLKKISVEEVFGQGNLCR